MAVRSATKEAEAEAQIHVDGNCLHEARAHVIGILFDPHPDQPRDEVRLWAAYACEEIVNKESA